MRFTTVVTAAGLVLASMSASACSSSGSQTPSVASITSATSASAPGDGGATTETAAVSNGASSGGNVCSLLTAARASSITGVTYTASTPSSGASGNSCLYKGPTGSPMNITVQTNAGSAAAWKNEMSTLGTDGEAAVMISGVGDRAATSTGSLGTQSGNWIIQVDNADEKAVNGGNIGGDFTASMAVAKAIIAALH